MSHLGHLALPFSDAGVGYVSVSGHSILRDTTMIALELFLEDFEGAPRTASITLAQLLLAAEAYFVELEEELVGDEDEEEHELSEEAVAELVRLEGEGYGEEEFVLLYAEEVFEGSEHEMEVLCLPAELDHLGLQSTAAVERAWQGVLALTGVEPEAEAVLN